MIFVYMIVGCLYIVLATYVNHYLSTKYHSDKLISKDRRKVERHLGMKHNILFVLNAMQVGAAVYFAIYLYQNGGTSLYAIDSFGFGDIPLLLLQVLFMLFVFDTNFYFMHRIAHHKKIFKHLHLDHHHYKFPTAWASLYMSPHDMVLTVSGPMLWIVLLGVPLSLPAYFVGLLMANFINAAGHDGHEISRTPVGLVTLPTWIAYIDPKRKWISKLFNTVTHHDLHHQKVVYNFSLYFTFWDTLLGTTYKDTDKEYREAIGEEV